MALGDDITLLSRAPLLSLLDEEALRLLAFAADRRNLHAGEVLFHRGDPTDGGYVVVEGALALHARPGEPAFVAGPGDLVGRTALFTSMRRPATATAQSATSVLHVSASLMRRMLEEFPQAASRMHAVVAAELTATVEGLARVRERLVAMDAAS
ncbi:cyclic nucleotide-binding domain-containing protein [Salinarimonas soli]|uniref:Crp/Fnr family transcriptional regulator n=1 Tax=Salinarimonas soli TaxID=1638099 RepID=A0A5B2VFS9_9HYPH|nr:Crp/Fnr family transcriptional regulator [Salinarimonas soli]KAA2237834.1 Crp/Fnr family transcriptional regulator [Salinarimonas soli]